MYVKCHGCEKDMMAYKRGTGPQYCMNCRSAVRSPYITNHYYERYPEVISHYTLMLDPKEFQVMRNILHVYYLIPLEAVGKIPNTELCEHIKRQVDRSNGSMLNPHACHIVQTILEWETAAQTY